MTSAPRIDGILESALYVSDLEKAKKFYSDILGLTLIGEARGRHLFYKLNPTSILLLFVAQATKIDATTPPHGTSGEGHLAFHTSHATLEEWQSYLPKNGVPIERTVTWPGGSYSLYFRDPDRNSLEITTASIWGK